jgi:hypothetical protein
VSIALVDGFVRSWRAEVLEYDVSPTGGVISLILPNDLEFRMALTRAMAEKLVARPIRLVPFPRRRPARSPTPTRCCAMRASGYSRLEFGLRLEEFHPEALRVSGESRLVPRIRLVSLLDHAVGVPSPLGDGVDGPLEDLSLVARTHSGIVGIAADSQRGKPNLPAAISRHESSS